VMNPVHGVTMKASLMVTAKLTHVVFAGARDEGHYKYFFGYFRVGTALNCWNAGACRQTEFSRDVLRDGSVGSLARL